MSVSQFFILSPRGETIISKTYRGSFKAGAAEEFFRKVKFWEGGDAPPAFNLDGTNYIYIKRNGIIFLFTTMFNSSPATLIELLNRIIKIFKDYCGVLSEEAIRKNFVLLYELLDEVIDYGHPQCTSTEALKNYIYNEPVLVDQRGIAGQVQRNLRRVTNPNKAPASSGAKPVQGATKGKAGAKQRNEIFVDIIERLNVLFSPSGYTLNSSIDGRIQMKSFLTGNPELRLALNDDLVIGKGGGQYGSVVLDDCNFHEAVRLDSFEMSRTLSLVPPDGEFVVLNYRVTSEFRTPFRLFPAIEEVSPYKLELVLMVRADIPESNYGANVTVTIPVPRTAASATGEMGENVVGQSCEYDQGERKLVWTIKKFPGGTEQGLRAKITLASATAPAARREIGPISMGFEIPMYNVSHLQVRYLRIAEADKTYNPYRWVRYVTQSNSYVCRV